MAQHTADLFLFIRSLDPSHGVHTLHTAAKVLAELQGGRQDRDTLAVWQLAASDGGPDRHIVLRGQVTFRSQWQLQAYWDYIQKRICDMIDDRKVSFRLELEEHQ